MCLELYAKGMSENSDWSGKIEEEFLRVLDVGDLILKFI